MADYVTVNVAQGTLRGKKGTTKSGGPLISFQGIPYAKPPLGPLRFKAPQPAESWTGTRDALKEGSPCTHYHLISNEFVGDEDCLFINVYTSKMPAGAAELLPVMVWIHGGAFKQGSGDSDMYGPDYLLDAGVLLVTFNYRLGPLGFLSLENDQVPGNAGLKDQVAALRWVQQNIANFGGDPNNVTIFGESAGAASVHYQMLSPMSKGLFKRAICQSGTAISSWAISPKPLVRAFQLGKALGCTTEDLGELLDFLRQATPLQLFEVLEKAMTEEDKRRGPTLLFVPCVEKPEGSEEAFITDKPSKLLSEGKFHQVPLMAGVNSHEGLLFLPELVKDPLTLDTIAKDFERIVPTRLSQMGDSQRAQDVANRIKKFYFGDKKVSQDTLFEYALMNSDLHFVWDMHNTVRSHATLGSAPVFLYKFSFDGAFNFFKHHMGLSRFPGACHADELAYLFRYYSVDLGDRDPTSPEMKTVVRMVNLWTNFAKTGNPTPPSTSNLGVQWTPFTTANHVYLNIDTELSMETHLEKERMDFWDQLYTQ